MKNIDKISNIFLESLPILVMIGLIVLIQDDFILTGIYIVITIISFLFRREKHDGTIYVSGFIVMLICESLFISTGVEKFERNSLFGIMPLWLPFLWAYGFITIRRAIKIIEK